jgi:hypothetical protein
LPARAHVAEVAWPVVRAGISCSGGENVLHILIAVLIIALVWALTGALGLPYIVSLVVTILAALYLLGPGTGTLGGGRWGRRAL